MGLSPFHPYRLSNLDEVGRLSRFLCPYLISWAIQIYEQVLVSLPYFFYKRKTFKQVPVSFRPCSPNHLFTLPHLLSYKTRWSEGYAQTSNTPITRQAGWADFSFLGRGGDWEPTLAIWNVMNDNLLFALFPTWSRALFSVSLCFFLALALETVHLLLGNKSMRSMLSPEPGVVEGP